VMLPPHACAPDGATVDVHDVDAGPGAAGAVAVGGRGWRVEVVRLA
jgi:hypothetical protein